MGHFVNILEKITVATALVDFSEIICLFQVIYSST
jgi:hypothetical protein